MATLAAASFDPFGGRREADWSTDATAATRASALALQAERFGRGFGDHEELSRTGFVHMNGRVYDPRLGRFLQPDPVVAAPHSSQGHNRYAYVLNRPLSLADPTGLTPVPPGAAAMGMSPVDINAVILGQLWDYIGWAGVPVYNLTGFQSIIARGMDDAEFAYYLRTGRDPRRQAQRKGGEWVFPASGEHGGNRDAFDTILTNGILGTLQAALERVNGEKRRRAMAYYNPTDGFLLDVLQALFQKFFPSGDWLGRRLADYLATRNAPVRIVAHSQGTLTAVNALRRAGALPSGSEVILLSPVVSYATAKSVFRDVDYVLPWGDVSNLLVPSRNPIKFASGLLDLFCGFCIHSGNSY